MKRLLSLLMVAVLLLTAIPIVPAFAVETADVAVAFEETVTAEPMLAAEPEDDTPVTVIDSGVCGELLTWELDSNSVLTISGEGEMTDYTFGYRNPPWLSHMVDVEYVVVENGVTHIGSEAFLDLKHVTSVKLPESLRSIGSSAFKRCSKLVDIELPSGLLELGDHAFDSCGALYRIEIPGGLTHLYGSTFEKCSLLTEVVFNEGLSYIGYKAFYGTNLTQIILPNSLIQIEDYAFQYCDFKEITEKYEYDAEKQENKLTETTTTVTEEYQTDDACFNAINGRAGGFGYVEIHNGTKLKSWNIHKYSRYRRDNPSKCEWKWIRNCKVLFQLYVL